MDDTLKKKSILKKSRVRGTLVLAAIFLAFAAFTAAWSHWDMDRAVSARFHSKDAGFWLEDAEPWDALYRYGTLPGLGLTLGAALLWFVSVLKPRFAGWRQCAALVALTSILGCGVLVNWVLKPYWGRPRPVQVREFGGEWEFRDTGSPGTPGRGQSFPSGHGTMGFVFVPLFFCRKKSRALAYGGAAFGLAWGGLLSATRVVQGAHFVSDTAWSLGIILLVSTALYYFVLKIPETGAVPQEPSEKKRARVAALVPAGLAVLVALAFLARRPFCEANTNHLVISPEVKRLLVCLGRDYDQAQVRFGEGERARIVHEASGVKVPSSSCKLEKTAETSDDTVLFHYRVRTSGFFPELSLRIAVILPKSLEGHLSVSFLREPCTP